MHGIYLSRLPLAARVFCTLVLVGIGCGALAALAQAATAIGLTPVEVQTALAPETPMTEMHHGQTSAEREIDIGQLSGTARVWIRTPLLIQTSHTHLFGQTLIAGLVGLIFLFASLNETAKAIIVSLPFAGTFLDIGGMWVTRFASPALAPLVLAGGSLFAVGYVLIAVITLYQLWLRTEGHP